MGMEENSRVIMREKGTISTQQYDEAQDFSFKKEELRRFSLHKAPLCLEKKNYLNISIKYLQIYDLSECCNHKHQQVNPKELLHKGIMSELLTQKGEL